MSGFKKTVIVDVDGTMSKVGANRLQYVSGPKKDLDKFYALCDEDEPVQAIVDLVKILAPVYNIVYCTGRRISEREKTSRWLLRHTGMLVYNSNLLMRKGGDHRDDYIIKPELLKEADYNPGRVAFILEDRNSVVKKWRELGFTCLQVADGDF